jgi:hypothetical protein
VFCKPSGLFKSGHPVDNNNIDTATHYNAAKHDSKDEGKRGFNPFWRSSITGPKQRAIEQQTPSRLTSPLFFFFFLDQVYCAIDMLYLHITGALNQT